MYYKYKKFFNKGDKYDCVLIPVPNFKVLNAVGMTFYNQAGTGYLP